MKHLLSGVIGQRHRQVIDSVVDQIQAQPGEDYGLKLMPPKATPASLLIIEKVSGFGGITGERVLGAEGKPVNSGSSKTLYWEPGSYQEHIMYHERDLLMLRKLGSIGERGATGLTSGELDHMSRSASKLFLRLKNRMNKLAWDTLFTGVWIYQGITNSFSVPAGNTIAAATDWSVSATAKPFTDLFNIMTQNALVRKYKIKEFVINPVTAAYMMQSAEAKEVLKNMNIRDADINLIGKFLYPLLPAIKVVQDAWQDESYSAEGEVVLGDTTYFVPDDKVLVVPDFGGSLYGEFGNIQLCENLNAPGATLETPAQGPYTFVDEQGLEKRANPHVKIVSGFNGGPNLKRSDDVIVITV